MSIPWKVWPEAEYLTREGNPARIFMRDSNASTYPLLGACWDSYSRRWTLVGWSDDGESRRDVSRRLDLMPPTPEKVVRWGLYRNDDGWGRSTHDSLQDAKEARGITGPGRSGYTIVRVEFTPGVDDEEVSDE